MRNDSAPNIAWLLASGESFIYCQAAEFCMDDISRVSIRICERFVDA
jgi:hypothetical protein